MLAITNPEQPDNLGANLLVLAFILALGITILLIREGKNKKTKSDSGDEFENSDNWGV